MLRKDSIGQLCGGRSFNPSSIAVSTVSVPSGTSVAKVIDLLKADDVKGAVIVVSEVENGTASTDVVGIFTERDYLDKFAGRQGDLSAPVDDYMTPSPTTLSPTDTIDKAIRWMTDGGYRHLPVTDEYGALVGLVSTRDIIAHLSDFFPDAVFNLPPRLDQDQSITTREGG